MNFNTKLNGYNLELIEEKGKLIFHLSCPGEGFENYNTFKEVLSSLNVLKGRLTAFDHLSVDCFGLLIQPIELLKLYDEIA